MTGSPGESEVYTIYTIVFSPQLHRLDMGSGATAFRVSGSPSVARVARAISSALASAPPRNVPAWRRLRRTWSREVAPWHGKAVLRLAQAVVDAGPWGRLTAYELLANHAGATCTLTPASVRRLSRGLNDWGTVDAFSVYVAGPAWREHRIGNSLVHAWARSSNRWLRRAALVSTVALNARARGGRGDSRRTLAVCALMVTDRDDHVVKALSWALRALAPRDPAGVARFLWKYRDLLAPRVLREVRARLARR